MDFWTQAIERNRDALQRIVATLFALAGLDEGDAPATLPRHLRSYVLRVLRPAESAVRRLIVVAARDLVVKLRPSSLKPRAQPKPVSKNRIVYPFGRPKPDAVEPADGNEAPIPAFPLRDPLKTFCFTTPRRYATTAPRVRALCRDWSVPVYMRQPEPPAKPEPTPDDPVDAARLCRRLLSLRRALDDLPKQARRMARLNARRKLPNRRPGVNLWPLRPGWPPGHRKRHRYDIDEVLRDCHSLARWSEARPDTS